MILFREHVFTPWNTNTSALTLKMQWIYLYVCVCDVHLHLMLVIHVERYLHFYLFLFFFFSLITYTWVCTDISMVCVTIVWESKKGKSIFKYFILLYHTLCCWLFCFVSSVLCFDENLRAFIYARVLVSLQR